MSVGLETRTTTDIIPVERTSMLLGASWFNSPILYKNIVSLAITESPNSIQAIYMDKHTCSQSLVHQESNDIDHPPA